MPNTVKDHQTDPTSQNTNSEVKFAEAILWHLNSRTMNPMMGNQMAQKQN